MKVRHINTSTQFLKSAIYSAEAYRGVGGRAARFMVRDAIDGARSGRIDYPSAVEQVGRTLCTTDPRRLVRLSGRLRANIRRLLA